MKKNNCILLLLLISLSFIALVRPNQVHAKLITVTGENFDQYFESTGDAFTKLESDNTVKATLTPNDRMKNGSFYLNQKISVEDDFTLVGEVYLGNKADNDTPVGGADGIGFAFYPGEIGQLGFAGTGVGIAGIKNAVGFRLDTCYNWAFPPDPNSSSEIERLGNDADWPAYGTRGGNPFGGFLTTNGTTGYVTNDYDSNKHLQLENYSVVKPDSKPIPIVFDYDGNSNTRKGTLTVTLGDPNGTETEFDSTGQIVTKMGTKLTWTREIESTKPLAMHMAGSTGAKYNEQYFIFKKFTFEPDKTVTVNDVWDDNDNQENERPTTGGFTIMHKTSETDYTEFKHYDTSFEDLDGNTLTTTIEQLPKRDDSGLEYSYKVVPDKIENTDYVSEILKNDDGEEWTFTHKFVGHIALNSVPESLDWTERPLPQSGELLNRDSEMTVTVEDNRPNKAGWNISAQVVPTETNEEFSLFSLVWKNPGSTEAQALNGLPVLSEKTADTKGNMYSGTWSKDAGILLKVNDDLSIGDYSGKLQIRWTLDLTPDG